MYLYLYFHPFTVNEKKIIVQIYFTEIFLMHRNKKLRRKRNNRPNKNFDVIVIRLRRDY